MVIDDVYPRQQAPHHPGYEATEYGDRCAMQAQAAEAELQQHESETTMQMQAHLMAQAQMEGHMYGMHNGQFMYPQ